MRSTERARGRPGVDLTRAAGAAVLLSMSVLLGACGSAPSPPPSPTARTALATPTAAPTLTVPPVADLGAITEDGLRAHLDALAAVSGETDGFRAVGSTGYGAAADLVAADLTSAGWQVREDTFTTGVFVDSGGSKLVVGGQTYAMGDVAPLIFAPGGDVEGPIVAIDWEAPASTGKGCDATGYGALPAGAIVLVPPGGCYRRDQVIAAQRAGAAGFIAGYPGMAGGDVLRPTLIDPDGLAIPAIAATQPVIERLATVAAAGGTARLVTRVSATNGPTRSIIADLPGSSPGAVIMLGAHLDSVFDGPGINDNGSGVAAILEIARALADRHLVATVRLALWGAEETGLHGSFHYVQGLSAEERQAIRVYLNADMVASTNGYAGVYDETGAPAGSDTVRDLLLAAVERAGGTPVTITVGGASDHWPFQQAGVPVAGVFSGANEIVSTDQAAASGSTPGLPAAPCYHLACDDGSDVDLKLARILTAALADVTSQLSSEPSLLGAR